MRRKERLGSKMMFCFVSSKRKERRKGRAEQNEERKREGKGKGQAEYLSSLIHFSPDSILTAWTATNMRRR